MNFDVIIVGAGPAGISCALHLAKKGHSIAIVEKDKFPRNKICGDGMTGYALYELNELGNEVLNEFYALEGAMAINGVRIFSPDSNHVEFYGGYKNRFGSAYYHTCRRIDFDNFLFGKLKQFDNIEIIEDFKVSDLGIETQEAWITDGEQKITGKIIIGADGPTSITERKLLNQKKKWQHYSLSVRCYYKNIQPLINQDIMEIYYLKELLPGYLWIFPLSGNVYNVGVGLVASKARKERINLKDLFEEIVKEYPVLSDRFKNATRISPPEGGIIPLSSARRRRSGERFLLLGDAASLANPISGEGIGCAMNSGRIASKRIIDCLEKNDFSAKLLFKYDREIERKFRFVNMRSKLILPFICKKRFIIRLMKNYHRNKVIQKIVSRILKEPEGYKQLYNPMFYIRMFIG